MTPTDDLRARLHSANTLFERMLRECARPVTGSPEGVPWLAAEAYREVAIAALSALPAGGGEVDAGGLRDTEIAAAFRIERDALAGLTPMPSALAFAIGVEYRAADIARTTPPPDAAVPSDDELPGMWSGADLIGGKSDAGWPRDGSALMDVALMLWHRFAAEHVERWEDEPEKAIYTLAADAIIRRLAAPAAGKGVDGLPAKWRATSGAIAKPYGFVTEHVLGKAQALDACADELEAALTRQPVAGDGMVLVPRVIAETAITVASEWLDLFAETPGLEKYERFTYGPQVELLRDSLIDRLAAPADTPADGGEGK